MVPLHRRNCRIQYFLSSNSHHDLNTRMGIIFPYQLKQSNNYGDLGASTNCPTHQFVDPFSLPIRQSSETSSPPRLKRCKGHPPPRPSSIVSQTSIGEQAFPPQSAATSFECGFLNRSNLYRRNIITVQKGLNINGDNYYFLFAQF